MKAIWQSKTFWGAIVTLVAVLFPTVWTAVGVGDDYAMIADKITGIIGTLLVIYGRLAAGGVSLTGK